MFDIKIPNEEIIESQKKRSIDDLTSEFDKKMIAKALDEVNDDKKDWVIRPLIFDSETSDPVSTPILSQLTFKTIGDSNLEILDKCGKMFEDVDNKYTKFGAYKDLSDGLMDNTFLTILNSIIESSALNFNAWWSYNANKYFPDGGHYVITEPPVQFYNIITNSNSKYRDTLITSIVRFLKGCLSFNKTNNMKNTDPDTIISEGVYKHGFYNYMETTAINISNLIGIIMVNAITTYLFQQLTLTTTTYVESNNVVNRVKKSSDGFKNHLQSQNGCTNFIHTCIEYILEDSLYDLIKNYIKPSIMNIFNSAMGAFFFMYQDLSCADNDTNKEK